MESWNGETDAFIFQQFHEVRSIPPPKKKEKKNVFPCREHVPVHPAVPSSHFNTDQDRPKEGMGQSISISITES